MCGSFNNIAQDYSIRLSSLVESHTADNLHACARRCRLLLPHKWFSYNQSTSTCLCAPYQYTDTRVDGEDIFVEDSGSVLYVSADTEDSLTCTHSLSSDAGYEIADDAITASNTNPHVNCGLENARLTDSGPYSTPGNGWCAAYDIVPDQWLQFSFGSIRRVKSIKTRGRVATGEWVPTYKVQYYNLKTHECQAVVDDDGNDIVFTGPENDNEIVTNTLDSEIIFTTSMRWVAITYVSTISGRVDYDGC